MGLRLRGESRRARFAGTLTELVIAMLGFASCAVVA